MDYTFVQRAPLTQSRWLSWAGAVVYLLTGCMILREYSSNHPLVWAAMTTFPFLLNVRQPGRLSFRYGIIAVVLLGLSCLLPVRTLYFLAAGFAGLYWIESQLGRINDLPVWLLLIISPFFNFITTVFGFPIRLQLSEWAGGLLQKMGLQTNVAGNVISINGTEFSVDPACVGLNMFTVSLIISLLLMAYHGRKTQKELNIMFSFLVLLLTFVLNIGSNFIRILLLVFFGILPTHSLHDWIGIACLIIYVGVPLSVLIPYLYRYSGNLIQQLQPNPLDFRKKSHTGLFHFLLFSLILIRGFSWQGGIKAPVTLAKPLAIPGYSQEYLASGVYKFSRDQALVYVKPIGDFYEAEHTPLICWRGSGYTFKQIERQAYSQTGGVVEVYSGILQKGKERIYTAWWFDNGRHKTISQADWRWRMGSGESGFSLVNVSCNTPQQLRREVAALLPVKIIQ